MTLNNNIPWWSEEYGFFGPFYIEGDNSWEGYLSEKKQNLAERTTTEVSGVVKLLNLPIGANILDIPCGYGRHSIELAKQGFQVTGMDINLKFLDQAIKSSKDRGVSVNFIQGNMLELSRLEEFDAIINMFYSFGFFDSDAENEQVVKNFFTALKPGGKFLMHTDVNVPRILSGKYKHDEVRTLASGKTLRIIDEYDPSTNRINGSWNISDNAGNVQRKDYSVRVYTKEEFTTLCLRVGFKSCQICSNWDGRPYSEESEDMIIIATK